MQYKDLVESLSESELRELYKACIIRITQLEKALVIDSDIIELWQTNKVEALLELRNRFPNYGLNDLKNNIYNKMRELNIPLRDGFNEVYS